MSFVPDLVPPALAAVSASLPPAAAAKDWKAAEGFAAMALGELFEPMFATVDLSSSRFGGGAGEQAWQPILVQAIGREVASEGGLSIAATVFRELVRQQEGARGLSAKPGDKR
ncbi:MAG TPA: chemotaxis protein chel [Acetobacteraceae bacterium]|nr:chemotaxis protein chel [Acetobacteraceae bacterium]